MLTMRRIPCLAKFTSIESHGSATGISGIARGCHCSCRHRDGVRSGSAVEVEILACPPAGAGMLPGADSFSTTALRAAAGKVLTSTRTARRPGSHHNAPVGKVPLRRKPAAPVSE